MLPAGAIHSQARISLRFTIIPHQTLDGTETNEPFILLKHTHTHTYGTFQEHGSHQDPEPPRP